MPNNMVLLERIELNASAASITFANIPQTGYTDLKVVVSARSARTGTNADNLNITFNGSSTSYSGRVLYGDSAAAASYVSATTYILGEIPTANTTANTFGNLEFYIPNYAGNTNKSVSLDGVTENNSGTSGAAYADLIASLWSNTSAITSITIASQVANFVQYSTFSLYGLAATGTTPAIAPKASGGNVIATDGTYWYHAFRTSGTFTPQVGLTADILVVAGGGGALSGGGGAGGLLAFTSQVLDVSAKSVTVGAGGASYANGTNSTFQGLTAAVGGGRGGANSTSNPAGNGGSGGGSMGNTTSPYGALAGGTGTSGQGNNGGSGFWGNAYNGGGGGGATAVGGNSGTTAASNGNGGAGGTGSSAYSSWGSATSTGQNISGTYWYAGGGGGWADPLGFGWVGGAAGNGGGAAGVTTSTGTAATANTGGGGGGGQSTGGAGGSGIIIVKYPI
jgi:hypothetical protein